MKAMQYNSETGKYEAPVEGGTLIVDADLMSENYPDGSFINKPEALDPTIWLNCLDGERVRIEPAS